MSKGVVGLCRNGYNDRPWNLNWLRRWMSTLGERWRVKMWIGDPEELRNLVQLVCSDDKSQIIGAWNRDFRNSKVIVCSKCYTTV